MDTHFCGKCKKYRRFNHFLSLGSNRWCRECRLEYGSRYRKSQRETYSSGVRIDFESSILTDAQMKAEMKNYTPPSGEGVNALSDFYKLFLVLCRLKKFPTINKTQNYF